MDSILFLTDQNIDIFNKSCEFYTDLCYHFESPNNKDVALRDRLLVYYPNITLCDSGCNIYGVNLTSMTAICTCKYKEMTEDNSEQEENNIYQNAVNEVFDILEQINLAVMACYKDLFQYKYFIKCTGGIIILCLIFIQFISIIIYYFISFFTMKKYIFNLTENYILLLNKSPMFNIIMENKINQKNGKHEKKSESGPPKKVLTSSGKDLKVYLLPYNFPNVLSDLFDKVILSGVHYVITNSKTSIPLANIHTHQIEHIKNILYYGGIAFLIVRFNYHNKTFLLPGDILINYLNTTKKKSISYQFFLDNCKEIPIKYRPRLDYLKTIDILWFIYYNIIEMN